MNKGDVVKVTGDRIHVIDSGREYILVYGHTGNLDLREEIEIGSFITYIGSAGMCFDVVLTRFGIVEVAKDDIGNL